MSPVVLIGLEIFESAGDDGHALVPVAISLVNVLAEHSLDEDATALSQRLSGLIRLGVPPLDPEVVGLFLVVGDGQDEDAPPAVGWRVAR